MESTTLYLDMENHFRPGGSGGGGGGAMAFLYPRINCNTNMTIFDNIM